MGIDISSKLLVGLPAEDILATRVDEDEELDDREWLEDLGLSYASYHYDCDPLDCVWGFEIGNGSVEEVVKHIREEAIAFRALTGLDAKVYQLPDVT